jgi:hypothetical protein
MITSDTLTNRQHDGDATRPEAGTIVRTCRRCLEPFEVSLAEQTTLLHLARTRRTTAWSLPKACRPCRRAARAARPVRG